MESWDRVICNEELRKRLEETVDEVKKNDPVHRLWVDASSLALGVAVVMDRHIVEDTSWLQKEDSCHINMAELDAVIKGLNLVLA